MYKKYKIKRKHHFVGIIFLFYIPCSPLVSSNANLNCLINNLINNVLNKS